MAVVAIYGAGQLGRAVADLLGETGTNDVRGPYGRNGRDAALRSSADVVVIATTTRLRDVADDIAEAVANGSNVLVSAEEAAFPWIVDADLAERLDAIARERGVSIAGAGINPGLLFDALVLTMLGPTPRGCTIDVRRVVDISGFGTTVLGRIGVGHTEQAFNKAVAHDRILGHAGFPQSMSIVANALGLHIERIDRALLPLITDVDVDVPGRMVVRAGESAGVDQKYTAFVDGHAWFSSSFYGHVALPMVAREAADDIELSRDGTVVQSISVRPGMRAQIGSQNMVANSVARIIAARPGWVTVAELAPALPAPVVGRDGSQHEIGW